MRDIKLLTILTTLILRSLVSPIIAQAAPIGTPIGTISGTLGPVPSQPGYISDAGANIHNANLSSIFNPAPAETYGYIRAQGDQARSQTIQVASQVSSALSEVRQAQQAALSYTPVLGFGPLDDLIEGLTTELMLSAPSKDIQLLSIPNPGVETLPYQFVSNEGDFKIEIQGIYTNLYKINPYYENRQIARGFGLISIEQADSAYSLGNVEDAGFYKDLAQGFLDIAVGLDPITGLARSTYELFIGKNLVTGEILSTGQRGLAFLGVMTGGGGRTLVQASRGMARIFNGASHLLTNRTATQAAIREGERLAGQVEHVIEGMTKNHRLTSIKTAEETNIGFITKGWERPYQDGSHVVEFVTLRDSNWVRVHGEANQARSWVIRESAIRGLTPQQIRAKFALPDLPSHISNVRVPAGTPMARGNVQYHQWVSEMPAHAPSGAVQYNLGHQIDPSNFTNMRRLPEVY